MCMKPMQIFQMAQSNMRKGRNGEKVGDTAKEASQIGVYVLVQKRKKTPSKTWNEDPGAGP